MKVLIPFFLLAISLGQYIIFTQALPVSNQSVNELNHVDEESNEAIPSSEVMPGRFLSDKEIQNMIYLAHAKHIQRNKKLNRTKRFIFMPQQQRLFQNFLQRKQERIRLRNERRRMRYQNRRVRLDATLKTANQIANQKLHTVNLRTQQQAASNLQQVQVQPQQLQATKPMQTTKTSASSSLAGTTAAQKTSAVTYHLVPVPSQKK